MSSLKSNKNIGYIQALLSAVIFGVQSLFVNNIYSLGVGTWMFQLLRSVMAFVILTFAFGRSSGSRIHVNRKDFGICVVLSMLGFVGTSLLLLGSYRFLGPGAATSLHFTYPTIVVIMNALFFKDKVTKVDILCLCLCMAGIACLYTPGIVSVKGVVMALSSGLIYALYIVILDKTNITERIGVSRLNWIMNAIAVAAFFVLCVLNNDLSFNYPLKAYLLCLSMAVIVSIIAVMLFQKGVQHIGSKSSTIISAAEPVMSIIVGALFFHEVFTVKNIIGSVFIIAATILLIVLKKDQPQ